MKISFNKSYSHIDNSFVKVGIKQLMTMKMSVTEAVELSNMMKYVSEGCWAKMSKEMVNQLKERAEKYKEVIDKELYVHA